MSGAGRPSGGVPATAAEAAEPVCPGDRMAGPAGSSAESAVRRRFSALAEQGRAGFVPYVTAGFPSLAHTDELLAGLADAGADVIELGVPFSDPVADGPTIQRSCQHALGAGATVDGVLETLARFRRESAVPVVLFSYLNPLRNRGMGTFLREAAAAGADGLLVTDLPVGADPDLEARIAESPLDLVRLAAPTTPRGRLREIARATQGFLYYIARTGVTGARAGLPRRLVAEIRAAKSLSKRPLAVGFGFSSPEDARAVAAEADAVVVGSALVDCLRAGGVAAAVALAGRLRAALDDARPPAPALAKGPPVGGAAGSGS